MIDKFGADPNDNDYERAVGYCTAIMKSCPASVTHACLKIEYLLRAFKLKDATQFSSELMKDPDMMHVPRIIAWRGRVMVYSGNDVGGARLISEALSSDPDLREAQIAMKAVKQCANRKEEASKAFKE